MREAASLTTSLPMLIRPPVTSCSRDGSEVVSAVSDRVRAEFYRRAGIAELLPARASL